MGNIAEFLVKILGYIMLGCYSLLKNYGLSIILFTLFTKVILFPVSLLTQKNSIKMVKMQPELDAIKIKYIDDKDKFTDAQLELYKKFKYNPFMDTLPLIIQIILVLGLIKVVYRPLLYVLDMDAGIVDKLNTWLTDTLGITDAGSVYQIEIIKQIQSGKTPAGIPADIIETIRNFDITFLGINLGMTPSLHGNYSLLIIPLLAGVSAVIMCMAQNRINVLQLTQSGAGKVAETVFMVAFSTYFAFLVPAGVGLYWIFGNLFAILAMAAVNAVMPPKKYIDYDYLVKVKAQKKKKEEEFKKYSKRERADYKRFFAVKDMQLMIYSESNGFYKYYAGMIDYICEKSDIQIHYVTSDPDDNIFNDKREQIHAYYIASDRYLVPLFMKLECDMCIMTMPDLEKYHIKRSRVRKDVEYVYMFHGMGSTAMALRKGALDWYDTVFSMGKDCSDEIRELEELYNTPKKTLVQTGYILLDDMVKKYETLDKTPNERPKILIAPSWQPDNIIDSCAEELLDELSKEDYDIILRPHPQMVRKYPEKFDVLHEKYDGTNVEVQTDFTSDNPILQADVLITDWSDICFEFAFSTKRPVLFINTPMKIMNSDYVKIKTVPVNISLRNALGKSIEPSQLDKANGIIRGFIDERERYSQQIENTMQEHFYNIGKSSAASARYVIKTLKNKQ